MTATISIMSTMPFIFLSSPASSSESSHRYFPSHTPPEPVAQELSYPIDGAVNAMQPNPKKSFAFLFPWEISQRDRLNLVVGPPG